MSIQRAKSLAKKAALRAAAIKAAAKAAKPEILKAVLSTGFEGLQLKNHLVSIWAAESAQGEIMSEGNALAVKWLASEGAVADRLGDYAKPRFFKEIKRLQLEAANS